MLKRLFLPLLLVGCGLPALADPFGQGIGMSASQSGGWMPEFLRLFLAWLGTAQRQAIFALREQIQAIQDGQGTLPILLLAGIAFLYGIVHAAGPGHGKIVIGGYFLTRRARLAEGIFLSFAMAFVQACSAVVLVGAFTLALDSGTRRLMDGASVLESFSYGLIVLLGLGLAWASLKGKACACGHEHGPDCRHEQPKPPLRKRELLASAVTVGLRPCTGAILILLFTFANQVAWAGILATFAMAVGTAITVSAVSLGAIGVQGFFSRLGGTSGLFGWIRRSAGVIGGLLIALAGLAMLAASQTLPSL